PPAACSPLYSLLLPLPPTPPPASPPRTLAALLRSPPTRSDIHGFLLVDPSSPDTPASPLSSTSPGPPSDTASLLLLHPLLQHIRLRVPDRLPDRDAPTSLQLLLPHLMAAAERRVLRRPIPVDHLHPCHSLHHLLHMLGRQH